MRPICGRPEKFRESLATPTANFPEIVNDCCCDRSYESAPDGPCWGQRSARAEALSYSSVKLFSKNSNLCDHGTVPERYRRTDGRTERQTIYCGITALCVASRGNKLNTAIACSPDLIILNMLFHPYCLICYFDRFLLLPCILMNFVFY